MCNEKITEQQKQLFILKLKNNNNNDNTRLLNYYSLSNILRTGGTKLIDYLCALIDLFTDMAAILNLLDLRSIIYGMPRGHSLVIYACFSGKKRTSIYISWEKDDHYYIQKSFFRLQSFSRKTLKKLARKACGNTDASILDHPHVPLGIP